MIFDFFDRSRYKFKRHLIKSCENDLKGAFLQTPYDMLHVEDIKAYIHCKYETIGDVKIYREIDEMIDSDGNMKEEFKHLEDQSIIKITLLNEF